MCFKRQLFALLLLIVGAVLQLSAQSPVTKGDQVTSEASLEEGVPYIIYQPRNSTYVKEASDRYSAIKDNSPDDAGVFYFVKVSDGVYKIKSHSTGKYISKPTTTGIAAIAPVEEASAGEWNLQYDSNGCIYPLCNGYGWDRGSDALWATAGASTTYSESGNVKLYKIYKVALSTTAFSEFTDKDVAVSGTAASSLTTGTWYVMSQRSRTSYVFENTSDHKLKHTLTKPTGSATATAGYLVRLISADGGKYYLQNGYGNYVGAIAASTNVPTTALPEEAITVAKIASTDGHFYLQGTTNGVVLDANDFTGGDPSTVVGWGTTAPTSTGGNNDWAFYPVTLEDSWVPTISEVYTINNTNANRGALIYNPDANAKYVWSSGKSGTFDASNVNSQWVIVPTATAKQYYLYNVGAGKFAIPTGIAQGSDNPWIFSDNAVAVTFESQSDGTKKIKMATTPVSGTNAAYMAVSNAKTYPIINYNDVGGNFTITIVDGQDQSTAANAAVAKLVKSQTALTTYPSTSGWYAIQIKSKSGSASYAGRYLQNSSTLYNNLYPLTFTGGVDVQPAITDPTFFTFIDYTSWDNNKWQLPDGRYLVSNGSNKFPTASATASAISTGYDGGNFFKSSGNYYADPYNSSANYYIGETATFRTTYNVYPIDLTAAGLTAWKVTINNASPSTTLTCTRNDVAGLTAVYNNGYFFLPSGTTPGSGDFTLTGMLSCEVDADAKTITAEYNPELSLLVSDVTVNQGNQTTGKGNTMQALLRVKATPFSDFQPTKFTINLTGASNVDNVKVYSTTSDQIRFAGVTPTLLGTTASPSEGSVEINLTSESVSAGTSMYYWVTADLKSAATEWETIDASITSISYTNAYKTAGSLTDTNLDLSSIGNPDGEMRIYKSQYALWTSSKSNSKYYRIPALLKTGTNTLLAFADDRYSSTSDLGSNHKIDVLVKKSTDGGVTWSNAVTVAAGDGSTAAGYGYGDAAVAQAANGDIVCLMAAGNTSYGSGMLHIGYTKSTDGGATWSSPIDIYGDTDHLTNSHDFQSTFVSSGHGITQTIANAGRIAFPALGKISGTTNEYVIYSDDNGATWTFTDNYGYTGADESKLVELNDGKLLMSIRTGGFNSSNVARGYNRTTDTNVENWGTQGTWSDLKANGCNSDLIYFTRAIDGKRDVLLHSVVKTYDKYRKDLRLYVSFDEGKTWKEAFQLQPGYSAYSSMQILDNGDLAILFEDGSIGNEDAQDCYDINYVTISKELMEARIDEVYDEYHHPVVTIISQGETNDSAPWGTWSPTSGWAKTFTTNSSAGVAGVVVSSTHDTAFNRETDYGQRVFCIKPSSAGATDVYTIEAPAGYFIKSYSIGGHFYTSSETYTLSSADGSQTAQVNTNSGTPNMLTVDNICAASTTFSMKSNGSSNSRYACITSFTVTLADIYSVNLNTVGDASYATLYLPFDVITDNDTKAYYISKASNGYATLTEVEDNEIAANTAVLLINETGNTAEFSVTSGLTQQVAESDNHLKGTLTSISLDLSGATNFYALGQKNNKIGFYKFDNSSTTSITLGANKAYLDTSATPSSARGFVFDFDGSSTGIESMDDVQGTTNNVQGTMYDLSGRRVDSQMKRGIYIVNGKKVIK